ncbi:type I restriction enzyme, S subunit [Pseudomonas cuatrocienegasensis]|uniref:Type I restriction enzyme, S subunit n=1 Tax=Pseudomonas cuatrocienegasensis TaxID=543360 RepID=A0ABY1BMK8_9PSED|nr:MULTISPECIES: restriction endonuclease subunit S [Pseudomonas]OEC34467.1 hypothetical protein A7D25_14000 [Pseudomonas sp. 21C1]SER20075.1 type I restriction enzyme, S subunit [Pseudomonas cuatrocienegasensis]
MSKTIPTNWATTSFDEVFSQISTTGKKVKTGETQLQGKFPVVDQGRTFISGYLNDESLVVSNDDPLIIFGDHTREIKWIDFPFIPGADGVKILKTDDELNTRYIYYFLRNLPVESKGYARHFKCLKEAVYLLPPLAEQTRIAQKLDELLAQVDTLKARIDAIPALLKRFRQSVLAAAVSGRLTEEWRKENSIRAKWTEDAIKASVVAERAALGFKPIKTNVSPSTNRIEAPISWAWLKLSEVALKITDGAHNTPKIMAQGFPYITAKDLTGGTLNFTEGKFISEAEHRELYNKCSPKIGDLLIVNIGAGTGNSANVDVDFEFSFKNIAIIKRPEIINPQYLKAFFDARKKTIFNEQTQGGAQPFLSLTMLGNIEIVLPAPEEQTEIVRRVEQLFAFAEQLERKVQSAKSRIDHLTQSILAKAFRGELVPQDPNDEPASVLLARIQAQRAAAPKAKRGRKASA